MRGHDDERGVVAVELAILLPLIIVILFAIIEFGVAFTRTLAYFSGAREGARYAAVHCRPEASTCNSTLIQNRVIDAIPEGYPVSFDSFDASIDCSSASGSLVTVSWMQDVPIDVPFLPELTWTVQPTGTFRCE